MEKLIESILQRWRPEDVAKHILDISSHLDFTTATRGKLQMCARAARRWSHMSTGYRQADDLVKQLKVAHDLFPQVDACVGNSPDEVRAYIDRCKEALGLTGRKSGTDFKNDRRNRGGRRHFAGVPRGHRAYNKRFRLLHRLDRKLDQWTTTRNQKELAQVAKSRLAVRLRPEQLTDTKTVHFVAYMSARLGVRSTFTWGSQQRPFDQVAEALLERLDHTADWLAVAYVHSAPEVLEHLNDGQKGRLLGEWFGVMVQAAEVLRGCVIKDPNLDLQSLVVRRGNDSSTWNEASGAFNKARDGWISTLYALGMAEALDAFAPPKCLRLMAADVVSMHSRYGRSDLEPDTFVWQQLPFAWQVTLGEEACTREQIQNACRAAGIEGKGWLKPRPKSVAETRPTPNLVHGVIVACPALAQRLQRAGYFSGKSLRGRHVAITRDYSGDTLVVSDGAESRL